MTEEQIEKAGRIIKTLGLAGMPGMDHVAVKLNNGLTYEEEKHTKKWARAFELALTDENIFECASRLASEGYE